MKLFTLFNLSIVAFVMWPTHAFAGYITELSVNTSSFAGKTLYTYTLTTDSKSDRGTAEFDLFIAKNANITNITGPSGWDVSYVTTGTLISWSSQDSSTDLTPGNSTTFSFLSLLAPGQKEYILTGYDSNDNPATNSGEIFSPSSIVPEPRSGGLLLQALILIFATLFVLKFFISNSKRSQ